MMKQIVLKQQAEVLKRVLMELAPVNPLAASLYNSLASLIEDALDNKMNSPMVISKVPGNRTYTEGLMDDTPLLANAYGAFLAALAGLDE